MKNLLFEMVNYAYSNVKFYNNLYNNEEVFISTIDEFKKLPVISDKHENTKIDYYISNDYKKFPSSDNVTIRRTSGSTGNYMKIYWDKYDDIRSLFNLWVLRKKYYNILPQDKYCYFYTTNYIYNKIVDEKELIITERSIGFSKNILDIEKLKKIYMKIYEFQPKWIMTQPSIMLLLTRCVEKYKLPEIKSIEYIELTGEMFFEHMRDEISSVYRAKIANQYGCNETNSIAYECICGNMHIMKSNVYVEIFNDGIEVDKGEEGNIYITSLHNHAMPFIRYKIGDIGKIIENFDCPCGNKTPILILTKGRDNDFIINSDGSIMHSYIFLRPIEHINEKVGKIIKQFQVCQNGINDFTVKMVLESGYWGWRKQLEKEFIEELRFSLVKDSVFKFEFYDILLPNINTGKLAYFIRKF